MFGPKTAIFAPKYAFLGTYRPCRLIWYPVGWLVGGCGARAASHKTPIYFMRFDLFVGFTFVISYGMSRRKDLVTETTLNTYSFQVNGLNVTSYIIGKSFLATYFANP